MNWENIRLYVSLIHGDQASGNSLNKTSLLYYNRENGYIFWCLLTAFTFRSSLCPLRPVHEKAIMKAQTSFGVYEIKTMQAPPVCGDPHSPCTYSLVTKKHQVSLFSWISQAINEPAWETGPALPRDLNYLSYKSYSSSCVCTIISHNMGAEHWVGASQEWTQDHLGLEPTEI